MNIEAIVILGMLLIVVGQLVIIHRLQHKVDLHKHRATVFIGRWQSAMSDGLKRASRDRRVLQRCGCGADADTVDNQGFAQCHTCKDLLDQAISKGANRET